MFSGGKEMPTVLTERLKERNFKLVDWMVEDVIRLFGLAACLRDEEKNLNKKQILKALKKYDRQKEKQRQEELNPKYPPVLSERKLKKNYAKLIKLSNKELKQNKQIQKNIQNCIKELKNIEKGFVKADYTDLVVGLLDTTKKQLNIAQEENKADIDYAKEILQKNSTFEKYKKNQEKERKQTIEYLEENKQEAQNQVMYGYADNYQKLINLFCKDK